jgi:hypothetical protein
MGALVRDLRWILATYSRATPPAQVYHNLAVALARAQTRMESFTGPPKEEDQ